MVEPCEASAAAPLVALQVASRCWASLLQGKFDDDVVDYEKEEDYLHHEEFCERFVRGLLGWAFLRSLLHIRIQELAKEVAQKHDAPEPEGVRKRSYYSDGLVRRRRKSQVSSPRRRTWHQKATQSQQLQESVLHLEYLYASPLNVSPLDIVRELETLAKIPNRCSYNVRTATTATLSEAWSGATRGLFNILCLSVHCVAPEEPGRQRTMLLEDHAGWGYALREDDLTQLLQSHSNVGVDAPAGRKAFSVVLLMSCNSLPFARRFVEAGAPCAVGCDGAVSDTASQVFLNSLLKALLLHGRNVEAAFAAAQCAVRLSPDPRSRTRAEAECFVLVLAQDEPGERSKAHCVLASLNTSNKAHASVVTGAAAISPCWYFQVARKCKSLTDVGLPPCVEDFVGRGAFLVEMALTFLKGRRAIWLHGCSGIGKTALAIEFCRFYGLPGGRLFSTHGHSRSGQPTDFTSSAVKFLRFDRIDPDDAVEHFQRVLSDMTGNCRKLVVLDGVDGIMSANNAASSSSSACAALCRAVASNLEMRQSLHVLLTSVQPWYEIPLPYKVVFCEIPPLPTQDAAMLLARRAHRPLFSQDFTAARYSQVPIALRSSVVNDLALHPLIKELHGIPGNIRDAATQITPQLDSLLNHPVLRESLSIQQEIRAKTSGKGIKGPIEPCQNPQALNSTAASAKKEDPPVLVAESERSDASCLQPPHVFKPINIKASWTPATLGHLLEEITHARASEPHLQSAGHDPFAPFCCFCSLYSMGVESQQIQEIAEAIDNPHVRCNGLLARDVIRACGGKASTLWQVQKQRHVESLSSATSA